MYSKRGTPNAVVVSFSLLIRYEWYRNGVKVSNLNGISYNTTTGVLEIESLTVDREGVFQCRAKNTFPERMQPVAVSAKIEVLVAREYWM